MNEQDRKLAQKVRQAVPSTKTSPEFAETWLHAERRADKGRRRFHIAAAAAVGAIAVIIVASMSQPQGNALQYIDMAELESTTYWSAPSDALLPDSQFDIYQDMPTLMESTDAYGGALL